MCRQCASFTTFVLKHHCSFTFHLVSTNDHYLLVFHDRSHMLFTSNTYALYLFDFYTNLHHQPLTLQPFKTANGEFSEEALKFER